MLKNCIIAKAGHQNESPTNEVLVQKRKSTRQKETMWNEECLAVQETKHILVSKEPEDQIQAKSWPLQNKRIKRMKTNITQFSTMSSTQQNGLLNQSSKKFDFIHELFSRCIGHVWQLRPWYIVESQTTAVTVYYRNNALHAQFSQIRFFPQ